MEADAVYEIEKAQARAKGLPHTVTVPMIERRFGFKPRKLSDWRNNQHCPCKLRRRKGKQTK
jgi:hypothetical protein